MGQESMLCLLWAAFHSFIFHSFIETQFECYLLSGLSEPSGIQLPFQQA